MKRIACLSLLLAVSAAISAEPSSRLAWTSENLARVKSGDPVKGKPKAESCAACHTPGPQAEGGGAPHLQGQLATYLYKQLRDYKDGTRENAVMAGMVAGLSDEDMADIAGFYSGQTPPEGAKAEVEEGSASDLVTNGDPRRILPPCQVCHEPSGQGQRIDVPALAGQNVAYTKQTLLDYRSGARHNDLYGRMRTLSQQLSDAEIEQLARYYSRLVR